MKKISVKIFSMRLVVRATVVATLLISCSNLFAMQADEKGRECMKQVEALEGCLNSLLPSSSAIEQALKNLNQQIAQIQPSDNSTPEGSIPDLNNKIKNLNNQLDGYRTQQGKSVLGLRAQENNAKNRLNWLKGNLGVAAVPAGMEDYKQLPAMQEQLRAYLNNPRVQSDSALKARIIALNGQVDKILKDIEGALNPQKAEPQQQTQGWGNWVLKKLGYGQQQ